MQSNTSSKTKEPNGLNGFKTPATGDDELSPQSAQVVIIGAGLAGLAAAQRLHESGCRDVIILEGQDRVGGRVHTVEHSDYLIELGAQWLHGADQNPLYNWLTEMQMLDDYQDAELGFKGLFCSQSNCQVDRELVDQVLGIVCDIKTDLSNNNFIEMISNNRKKFTTASSVFKHQLDKRIEQDEQLSSHRSLVYAIFEWFLRYETIENGCDNMDNVSTASYTDWIDWGDGSLMNFKRGYKSLLEWFSGQIPIEKWLKLNSEVQIIELLQNSGNNLLGASSMPVNHRSSRRSKAPISINYLERTISSEQLVGQVIETNDRQVDLLNDRELSIEQAASGGLSSVSIVETKKTIECQHVIVTVSLGCLKRNHETLFKPQLPEYKRQLINTMGFGTVNKIVLEFDEPFWQQGDGIKLVWHQADHDNSRQERHMFPAWTRDILAFDSVRRQPNMLIGWIGGQGAQLMEHETDEMVGQICLQLLSRFLPHSHKKPTNLISCTCTRWNTNPNTCGSYSFRSIESFELNVDRLHEPIYARNDANNNQSIGQDLSSSSSSLQVPRIMFAGEATAGELYSTTHGAVISGWREADRLMKHLTNGDKQLL